MSIHLQRKAVVVSLLATVLVAEGVVDGATPFAPGDQLQFALITDDPEGRRSTPSFITTTFATESATLTQPRLALTGGQLRPHE